MKYVILAYLIPCCNILFCQIDTNGLPVKDRIIAYPLHILNSEYRDVNLSITPNCRYLYFMSGRGQTPWSEQNSVTFRGNVEHDGDIWFSEKKDTSWQAPKYLPSGINTVNGEDEPNISADGQTVYFQSWHTGWQNDGGPYYRAELYGTQWENAVGIGSGINQFFRDSMSYYGYYATDGMSISADGKLFLVVAGADYQGNLDIYISRKDERGNWSYPKRLAINTSNDERSVFIAGDGKTIYFGSDGRGGAGKLDIFKATLQPNDVCSEIINIGAPFNTPDDDYGFIIGALGTDAYFVRNNDIYYAKLENKGNLIKPQRTIVINGTVKDCDGHNAQSLIELYNTDTNERLATARSNAVTGEYSLAFPYAEGIYLQRFVLQKDQSIIRKQLQIDNQTANLLNFEITPDCDEPQAISPSAPAAIVATIYFEFDRFDLTNLSKQYLDSLTSQLDTNYRYQIQLTGHTDSLGSNAYNLGLSEKRVKTVANYFLQFEPKINAEIDYKGETLPFLTNTNAQNRAQNRRVEIKIVQIQSDSMRLKQ